MTHLYTLESTETIFLIEGDRILKEHGCLPKVLDGDGDSDGGGHPICLQVDVLQAVCPQQVRGQQGEPVYLNHQMGQSFFSILYQRLSHQSRN